MLNFSTTTPPDPDRPRDVLFTIDGRDVSIPQEFTPIEMARYAHQVDQFGGDMGAIWALRHALGDADYLAFINLPPDAVTRDDYAKVIGVITGRLVGLAIPVPEGKGEGGAAPETTSASPSTSTPTDDPSMEAEPPDEEVWPETAPSSSPGGTPKLPVT
jgi:hypothetical protein